MTTSSAQTEPISALDNTSREHLATPPPAPADKADGIPVLKVVLFVAGTALLIVAAANLNHMGDWTTRWGQIPVFLVFFLIMSLAGRWFWTGADAIVSAIVGNKR
ncbi:hypothetical protein [Gordonia sp. CPCC 205333]|uniref:hypothetical protein n=1 Tax=Gordonia sp. CPCC 205333 TaxID=3140790 RepID=UPI003AF34F31